MVFMLLSPMGSFRRKDGIKKLIPYVFWKVDYAFGHLLRYHSQIMHDVLLRSMSRVLFMFEYSWHHFGSQW